MMNLAHFHGENTYFESDDCTVTNRRIVLHHSDVEIDPRNILSAEVVPAPPKRIIGPTLIILSILFAVIAVDQEVGMLFLVPLVFIPAGVLALALAKKWHRVRIVAVDRKQHLTKKAKDPTFAIDIVRAISRAINTDPDAEALWVNPRFILTLSTLTVINSRIWDKRLTRRPLEEFPDTTAVYNLQKVVAVEGRYHRPESWGDVGLKALVLLISLGHVVLTSQEKVPLYEVLIRMRTRHVLVSVFYTNDHDLAQDLVLRIGYIIEAIK